jgi:hypothetical protein
MTEDLLYAKRPCQRSRVATCLNLSIEKSEANAAYFPSFPTMPTPTSAAYIIATSFPPSPIDKTVLFVNSLIASVTNAF